MLCAGFGGRFAGVLREPEGRGWRLGGMRLSGRPGSNAGRRPATRQPVRRRLGEDDIAKALMTSSGVGSSASGRGTWREVVAGDGAEELEDRAGSRSARATRSTQPALRKSATSLFGRPSASPVSASPDSLARTGSPQTLPTTGGVAYGRSDEADDRTTTLPTYLRPRRARATEQARDPHTHGYRKSGPKPAPFSVGTDRSKNCNAHQTALAGLEGD